MKLNLTFKFLALAALGMLCGGAFAESEAPGDVPTFAEDIAPILNQQCVSCHHPGGGGPWDFREYDEVKKRARLIGHVVETGYMPPWKVDRIDGLTFSNERHLPQEDLETLVAWAEGGRPAGDMSKLPPKLEFTDEWKIGTPDVVLEMERPFNIPADGPDIYRNFVVRIPNEFAGKYLRGIEYRPTAKKSAHHTLFFLDNTGEARKLAYKSEVAGFAGMDSIYFSRRVDQWAVGGEAELLPAGTAFLIEEDTDILLQCHFHPLGKAEVEQAELALFFQDEAPENHKVVLDIPFAFGLTSNIDIPAGAKDYKVHERFEIPVDVKLAAIFPHAHTIATGMEAHAVLPDGTIQPLLSLSNWDFDWQERYRYTELIDLPAGTVVECEFTYDNSADNPNNPNDPPARFTWGPDTDAEMACETLFFVVDNEEDKDALMQAYVDQTFAQIDNMDMQLAVDALASQRELRMDINDDGNITLLEKLSFAESYLLGWFGPKDEFGFRMYLRRQLTFTTIGNWASANVPLLAGGGTALVLLVIGLIVFVAVRRRKRAEAAEHALGPHEAPQH